MTGHARLRIILPVVDVRIIELFSGSAANQTIEKRLAANVLPLAPHPAQQDH